MIYQDISNITKDIPLLTREKSKVSISKLDNFAYSTKWSDLSLWGTYLDDKMFVRYTKVSIGDIIPIELNSCFRDVPYFRVNGSYLIAKYIGRYIGIIDNKSWVLDVVFPSLKTNNREYQEYMFGKNAIHPNWKYILDDSNMRDFVMEKIEIIPHEERDVVNVLRMLMSEFSSVNSASGLIEGKWGGDYFDGISPTDWTSPSEIFLHWSDRKKPVKYGQCWVFAECFTMCTRFLGIPSRTVFAKNSHINPVLDGYVDFFEDETFMKCGGQESLLRRIGNVREFIESSDNKCDMFENCEIYSTNDSMWNIHYWNECIIAREEGNYFWEAMDSCPYVPSNYEPYKGKQILGPCRVLSIKSNYKNKLYDYEYLHASVNSPFRIWIKETTVLNGEIITIPYVHSIIYPLYPKNSIMTTNKKLKRILSKEVRLTVRNNNGIINITDNYQMGFELLVRYLLEDNPAIFYLKDRKITIAFGDDNTNYYVQQVLINDKNSMSKIRRQKCKLNEVICVEHTKSDRILSILIIQEDKYWVQLLSLV